MSSTKSNKKEKKKKEKKTEKSQHHISVPNYKFHTTIIEMSDLQKLMKGDPATWTQGELIGNYNKLKQELGRVPSYSDMRKFSVRIPWAIYKYHYGNWENFMKQMQMVDR
jgi:hypothetical protein